MEKNSIDFSRYAMAAAALGSVAVTPSAEADFTAPYALNPPANGTYTGAQIDNDPFGNWTSTLSSLSGFMQLITNQPASVQQTFNNFAFTTVNFSLTAPAPASGTVQFNWSFTNTGFGALGFGYLVNGTFTQLATTTQSNLSSFPVNAGDVFGFRLTGNYGGVGNVTISNFSAPVPEPSITMLAALGAVGLLAMRAVRRRYLARS